MSHLLFHFMARNYIAGIITRGILPQFIEIPGRGPSLHPIVSLTSDPDPTPMIDKSLVGPQPLSGVNLSNWRSANPTAHPSLPVYLPWTPEFRVHIEVPDNDPALYAFLLPDVAPLGFKSQTEFDSVLNLGGGGPGYWYAYLGVVPTSYILDIQRV